MSKKKIISTTIAILISVVFLYLAFRQIDFRLLVNSITTMNWFWTIPFTIVTWVTFWLRAVRWRILLLPTRDIHSWSLFGPMMIGFGFNSVFPARVGEFARPFALTKKEGIPFTTGLSSVVLERFADALALLGFFMIALMFVEFDPELRFTVGQNVLSAATLENLANKLAIIAGLIFLCSVLALIEKVRNFGKWMIGKIPFIPHNIRDLLIGMVDTVAEGLASLRSPKLAVLIVFYSLLIWFLGGLTFWILSWGFPGVEMNVMGALIFLVTTCIFISLPSAPGYWGLYEWGGYFALVMLGAVAQSEAGKATAMGYTIVAHFIQWALATAIGLYYAGKIHVSVGDAVEAQEEAEDVVEHEAQNA